MISIGKIGVRSSGPAGSIVAGLSGGSGSPGRSGRRFTQWVGIRSSVSVNLVWADTEAILDCVDRRRDLAVGGRRVTGAEDRRAGHEQRGPRVAGGRGGGGVDAA